MNRLLAIGCFFLLGFTLSGQELGEIRNGDHLLKLVQDDVRYRLIFSDVKAGETAESSFDFFDKDKLYNILLAGFNDKSHQVFVQANKDTIIKLSYKQFRGEWMVMIKQENMDSNTERFSSFFNKTSIQALFGNP